jgi:Tol biopolymer transport system component
MQTGRAVPGARHRAATAGLVLAAAIMLAPGRSHALDGTAAPAARDARPFIVEDEPFVIGQAADWLDRDHVVWHDSMGRDEDDDGQVQIHRSALDGTEKVCLTCGLDGPNQVPVVQPHGDWILFHSWNGHAVKIGAPGFGGLGSDLWVMTRDGRQRTKLTADAEYHDNFHAYWSPDGRYLVWTALNWNADEGGDGRSDVRVARFDPHGPSGPRLVDEHVVRPGNGHWYETQWWAPDGSGFLYTETVDNAVNPELFFCRLRNRARGACQPERLTHDLAWDEQAVFTADMKRILFMSSRGLPGAHNDWAIVTTLLDLPADYDYVLVLLVFSDSYLQPVFQQATDLYELPLRWNVGHTRFKPGTPRRLTRSGDEGWVIPEFAWDPSGRRLLWTQNKFADGVRVDQTCIVKQLRGEFLARLGAVHGIFDIPLDLHRQMRDTAGKLLQDPAAFPFQGRGCGEATAQPRAFAQVTRVGHFGE